MHKLKKQRFSSYGLAFDGRRQDFEPSRFDTAGKTAINISSFTMLCDRENISSHSTKKVALQSPIVL